MVSHMQWMQVNETHINATGLNIINTRGVVEYAFKLWDTLCALLYEGKSMLKCSLLKL